MNFAASLHGRKPTTLLGRFDIHLVADDLEHEIIAAADFEGRITFADPENDPILGRGAAYS